MMAPDIFNLTDVFQPVTRHGIERTVGVLVVGVPKSEAEFVAAYDGRTTLQQIRFEDQDGNPEAAPRGIGAAP